MANQDRAIRVFISSTFRDLQQEREELVKFIFPKLRRLCEERGVTWGEVDLRWGVSDEQKAEGKVLPICLEEIHHCRPYFIGILGERYGWIPESIPEDLIKQQPWLKEHLQKSVTELEIHYGVFHEKEMSDRAFFYFRDSKYIDTIALEHKRDFIEHPYNYEIAKYGLQEAEHRANLRKQKLDELKQCIRDAYPDRTRVFRNSLELGELVWQDMQVMIDKHYPVDTKPDPLQRDAFEHEQFAQSRCRVYIGREEYFQKLDDHAKGDGPPLVIVGDSGSGKSALLANWALRYREKHRDDLVLMHFIGATTYSADWALMVRRIMAELQRAFKIEGEIPDKADALRQAFANWLNMAAARGRVILILDALNQLEDRDGAPDLVWLPPVIPQNVRLILSTLPGRSLEDIKRRVWPTLRIEPFTDAERYEFIEKYLKQFTKTLGVKQSTRIIAAKQTANPLYLQAMLEELRLFGEHERLDERIDDYLQAVTIPDLYAKILARYEEDYERDRVNLVKDSFSLFWAARRGLSENELLELLGADGEPLPAAVWAPLYLAARQSLTNRSGLLGFSHDYFRQAVMQRFVPIETTQQVMHSRLAKYFSTREQSLRQIDELPWQLAQAGQWQELADLLIEPEFFKQTWSINQYEVKTYWVQIECHSAISMLKTYEPVLQPSNQDMDFVWGISILFYDVGHLSESLVLRSQLAEHYRAEGDLLNLQACLGNQGLIFWNRGDLNVAMRLFKEQELICRELGNFNDLQLSLGNQGLIFWNRGDLDGAMSLYKEQERICRELKNKDSLQRSLGNQANIFYSRGDLDGAMSLYKEQECICRELGNVDNLQVCLDNQGRIFWVRGDLDGAMKLYKEDERICRELGNKSRLQISLGNQGVILFSRGDLDVAMRLLKEQELICCELGYINDLQLCLCNQGNILHSRGDLDGAMSLYKEQERICLELGNKEGLQGCLGSQGVILEALGDLDGAMTLYKEQERICRDLGNINDLQRSLGNQANIFYSRGDLDGAMNLHKEQERICRELGNKDSLQRSLGNQAIILFSRGDLDGAMSLYKEQERICREMGNKDSLQIGLGNQGVVLDALGDLGGAMNLYKEKERICRELDNKDGLQSCLGKQGVILFSRGDLDGAMSLYKEQERICRKLKNKDSLQRSFCNQGVILFSLGDLGGAMTLYKEQERICRDLGNINDLQRSLGNQANIFYSRGDLDGAMSLYKEQERICRELGIVDGLWQSLYAQALICSKSQPEKAISLFQEVINLLGQTGLAPDWMKKTKEKLSETQQSLRS